MNKNFTITDSTSVDDLYDYAVDSLNDVMNGEKFIVNDLFRGFEWKRIPMGSRTRLGKKFFDHQPVSRNGMPLVKPLGKTAQNQQIYLKTF